MRITFHGAARTVTGSKHLVEVGDHRLLLDCGLFQGRMEAMDELNRHLPFEASDVDAVVLSHAHLDHCGNLPNLVKSGFRGVIHATSPTVDLSRHIMLDSAKIQESDARYANRHRDDGAPRVRPIYTSGDAERARRRMERERWHEAFAVVPGVTARFEPAGHILGAAVTVLELEEGGRRIRLGFSGDLGRYGIPLLEDPTPLHDLDYLILETTYGDREHPSPDAAYDALRELAQGCCEHGGKLLIPSFALGRAQDLIFCFHRMMDAGEIPRLPVYVDSPLAVRLTDVFRRHRAAFDEDARWFTAHDLHGGPLDYPQVKYISEVAHSKALNDKSGPMVIISPSGMLTGGRVRHHLAQVVGDPANTVLLVSWQAPHTLGRRLVEGSETIRLFGHEHRVRARVKVINGFSAHADAPALERFAVAAAPTKGTFLVHCEPRAADAMADRLRAAGLAHVAVPDMGETAEL